MARVLVVDDNADQVATLTALLELEGFETQGHRDANKIVACIREYDPHAVILDLAMPGKSGLDAAKEIREAFPHKRGLLLIAVTAERTQASAVTLAAVGFDSYLKKPCEPSALLRVLAPIRNA